MLGSNATVYDPDKTSDEVMVEENCLEKIKKYLQDLDASNAEENLAKVKTRIAKIETEERSMKSRIGIREDARERGIVEAIERAIYFLKEASLLDQANFDELLLICPGGEDSTTRRMFGPMMFAEQMYGQLNYAIIELSAILKILLENGLLIQENYNALLNKKENLSEIREGLNILNGTEHLNQDNLLAIIRYPQFGESIARTFLALHRANILTLENKVKLLKCCEDTSRFRKNSGLSGLGELCSLLQEEGLLTQENYLDLLQFISDYITDSVGILKRADIFTQENYLALMAVQKERERQLSRGIESFLHGDINRALMTLGEELDQESFEIIIKHNTFSELFSTAIPALRKSSIFNEANILRLAKVFARGKTFGSSRRGSYSGRGDNMTTFLAKSISWLCEAGLLTQIAFNSLLEKAEYPIWRGIGALMDGDADTKDEVYLNLLFANPEHAPSIGKILATLSRSKLLNPTNVALCMSNLEHLSKIASAIELFPGTRGEITQDNYNLIIKYSANAKEIAQILSFVHEEELPGINLDAWLANVPFAYATKIIMTYISLYKAGILSEKNKARVIEFAVSSDEINQLCGKLQESGALSQASFETIIANIPNLKAVLGVGFLCSDAGKLSFDRLNYLLEQVKRYPERELIEEDYDDCYGYNYSYYPELIQDSNRALLTAIKEGDLSAVRRLLADENVDVNCISKRGVGYEEFEVKYEQTPLVVAMRYRQFEIAKYLVEYGAYLNLVDDNPLIFAAEENLEMVRYFVEHGADIHAINESNENINYRAIPLEENALDNAVLAGHIDIVEYLIGKGADVNKRLCDVEKYWSCQYTILGRLAMFKIPKDRRLPMMEYLINHGANAESREEALHIAIKGKNRDLLELLKSYDETGEATKTLELLRNEEEVESLHRVEEPKDETEGESSVPRL